MDYLFHATSIIIIIIPGDKGTRIYNRLIEEEPAHKAADLIRAYHKTDADILHKKDLMKCAYCGRQYMRTSLRRHSCRNESFHTDKQKSERFPIIEISKRALRQEAGTPGDLELLFESMQ